MKYLGWLFSAILLVSPVMLQSANADESKVVNKPSKLKLVNKSKIRGVPVKQMSVIEQFGLHRRQTKISDEYGERVGEGIICPCIFDVMRDLQPIGGKFTALGYVWSCKVFDQYGLCREAKRVGIDKNSNEKWNH